ncbi:MAG: MBL fold metallo-hydrolase [Pseudomonadota bacterium]|nr:MBL fold metallo-hydrolase [Pseudomonadota bacterium]
MTILGCGSSGGVPRIGGLWGACDPANPKNRRRRCSVLVERTGVKGSTRVLIDTSPDLREQLLAAGAAGVDGVVFTHAHADHTHGIDELRAVALNTGSRVPVWADPATAKALEQRFAYAFKTAEGSEYPPILDLAVLSASDAFAVSGKGGDIVLRPFPVEHGNITALGYRIAGTAYTPDLNGVPELSRAALHGLDCWIVDALRRRPHPSHWCLAETLDWIERFKPGRAVVTNMHIDLDYETLCRELPAHVTPAFDGMAIDIS